MDNYTRKTKSSFSLKKKTLPSDTALVTDQLLRQSTSKELYIRPACLIPYIDFWSRHAEFGTPRTFLQPTGCSINTLQSIFLKRYALDTSPLLTWKSYAAAYASKMRIVLCKATGAYISKKSKSMLKICLFPRPQHRSLQNSLRPVTSRVFVLNTQVIGKTLLFVGFLTKVYVRRFLKNLYSLPIISRQCG